MTDSDFAYIAFRLSFFETLERIVLAGQMGVSADGAYGYLAEVPWLRNTAPQVQLDLLVECWQKLRSERTETATLVDESILYSVCEAGARIVDYDPEFSKRHLASGPRMVMDSLGPSLGDQLRFLHLSLPNEGRFLLLSQLQDVEPETGERLKHSYGLDTDACEPMFEVLARWHVSPAFRHNGAGLLTVEESVQAAQTLGANRTVTLW